jgi:hypothetical protein
MSPDLIGILGIVLLFVLLLCRMWVAAWRWGLSVFSAFS